MISLLKQLCALDGVSGWEDEVRDYIRAAAAPYADEVREDVMGNLLVFRRGRSAGKTVMAAAHMDEVGLIVRGATDDGYLRFGTAGGIDRRVLLAKGVRCGTDKLPGVIGLKAVHLSRPSERENIPAINELYIDIGASSKDEALKKVPLGEPCAFDTEPEAFGKGLFKAKAIDDRAGCAVMLRLLEERPAYDTWFVFTVQEEVGLRGARTAAYALKPDMALILEGTTAADLPDCEGTQRVCAPGGGVVLSYMDNSAVYDRGLFERLRELADSEKIPWQLKRAVAGGTDAGAIQRSRSGVPVAGLSAAVRYIHSPVSVVSPEDIENQYKLAKMFLM
ncbi:MAG: M42 family metallopeptidase [Oscillospiraceae bacterium]|jgi:endoglucanase|nr:M42 family metallopeptidase [Oscillospiraceae bacterium]